MATSAQHQTAQPSAMLIMHQRYEAATSEYDVVDCARPALPHAQGEEAESHRRELDEGCTASLAETDALRTAILLQVPRNALEAAILQFHIAAAFDMLLSYETLPKHEKDALNTAISTMHDYLCRMAPNAGQVAGNAFAFSAAWADRKRRYRTGHVTPDPESVA